MRAPWNSGTRDESSNCDGLPRVSLDARWVCHRPGDSELGPEPSKQRVRSPGGPGDGPADGASAPDSAASGRTRPERHRRDRRPSSHDRGRQPRQYRVMPAWPDSAIWYSEGDADEPLHRPAYSYVFADHVLGDHCPVVAQLLSHRPIEPAVSTAAPCDGTDHRADPPGDATDRDVRPESDDRDYYDHCHSAGGVQRGTAAVVRSSVA